MAEVSGITELQMLESEVTSLKKTLKSVQGGDKTSAACGRVITSITNASASDGFLITEGGEQNQYHTSAGGGGEGGCCVVS